MTYKAKNPTGKAKTLNDGEFKRLIKKISSGNHGLRNQAILYCSYKLGLRVAEIASLNINHILGVDGSINKEFIIKGKGDKSRVVYLSNPKLIKVLQDWIAYRKNNDVVFNMDSALFLIITDSVDTGAYLKK